MSRFVSEIAMDGATCLKAEDGSVMIRRNTVFNWIILVVLGLILLSCIAVLIGSLAEGRSNQGDGKGWGTTIAGILFLGGVMFVVARQLRIPPVYVDVNSRVVEIGRGSSLRQIPFSGISHVAVGQKGGVPLADEPVTMVGIGLVLDSGEAIPLGTVSGSKAGERAVAIAQLVADTTGAPRG